VLVSISFYSEMCSETPCCIAFIFYGSLDIQTRITVNKYWHYIGTSFELKNVKFLETYCIGRRNSLCTSISTESCVW